MFNILINGQTVETNFDVFARAGGANRAIDRAYTVAVTNGQITIQLVPVVSNPKISAIEISAPGDVNVQYVYSPTQNNGQITSMKDLVTGEEVTYQYDSLGRLTSAATTTNAWGQNYTYDGFGNLTNKAVSQGSGPFLNLSVDPNTNRILNAGFAYDLNGNVTSAPGGIVYHYDVDNRLADVNSNEFYAYGPGNERIWKKKSNGTEEIYFYGIDGQRMGVYQPTIGGGSLSVATIDTNLSFPGIPITSRGANISTDRLNSTRVSGLTTSSWFPYGEEQVTTAQDREKFGGYFRDGTTNLDYATNRYYSSDWGRLLTPDPGHAGASVGDPRSWNRYAFVGGDPVNLADPNGLSCVDYGSGSWQDNGDSFGCNFVGYPTGFGPQPGITFRNGDACASGTCSAPGQSSNFPQSGVDNVTNDPYRNTWHPATVREYDDLFNSRICTYAMQAQGLCERAQSTQQPGSAPPPPAAVDPSQVITPVNAPSLGVFGFAGPSFSVNIPTTPINLKGSLLGVVGYDSNQGLTVGVIGEVKINPYVSIGGELNVYPVFRFDPLGFFGAERASVRFGEIGAGLLLNHCTAGGYGQLSFFGGGAYASICQ